MTTTRQAIQEQASQSQASLLPPILCAVTLDPHGQACMRYAWQRAVNTQQPLAVAHIAHQTMRSAGIHQSHNRGHRMLPIVEIAQQLLGKFVDDFLDELADDAPRLPPEMMDRIVDPGIPGSRIPELARRIGAASIVIGGTRRSNWQRRLKGSVTCSVLRRTSTPVFVVDAAGQPIGTQDFLPDLRGRGSSDSVFGLP
jgi:nucleotide-binding universal stress UspA family protein